MKKFIVVVGLLAVNVLAGCGHGRGACAHEKGGTAADETYEDVIDRMKEE